jgi:DHA2 family multidrug resistance protein
MSDRGMTDPVARRLLTASVLTVTLMNTLDMTIANVALPHIQGSLSTSRDQITWVLTSYIVAAAIMTPMTGWLSSRFGLRSVMLVSVVGFTIASGLCGMAQTLPQIVAFRLLQGVFGAAMTPMSQVVLMNIYPVERRNEAMSIWMMGAILGPIMGPVLGGYLTDNFSWRWVFYINLPVGMISLIGISAFLERSRNPEKLHLDFFGFGMLALAIGAFQLMLDRGQQRDWFSSTEIGIEAAVAAFCLYLFIVQTVTAKRPFVDRRLFADRNFVLCTAIGFLVGVLLFGVLSILPQMLEQLMGYPVVTTGMLMAPRGIGSFLASLVGARLGQKIDLRILIGIGLMFNALALHLLCNISLQMDGRLIVISGFLQGIGSSTVFAPLATLAFATLDPSLRNEGTAMFTLVRNLGSSVGISVLQVFSYRTSQAVNSQLVERLRPDNPVVATMASHYSLTDPAGIGRLLNEVERQAIMVSYINVFYALAILTVVFMIPLFFLSRPKRAAPEMLAHAE